MRRKSGAHASTNQIRIIGGRWRGRKLDFPSVSGLRPTGDRIRETLFNWLGQNLEGMRVLDLFAGSGALGIEALSRGAASADFVEINSSACAALKNSLTKISADHWYLHQQTAESFIRSCKTSSFDLLFLDPPFANNLHEQVTKQLVDSGLLAEDALIYVESPSNKPIYLPPQWQVLKNKQTGDVCYQLLQVDCSDSAN